MIIMLNKFYKFLGIIYQLNCVCEHFLKHVHLVGTSVVQVITQYTTVLLYFVNCVTKVLYWAF